MREQSVAIYCVCDEAVKALDLSDDPQCKMSTSEVMTFAVFSALWFEADYRKTRLMTVHYRYFPFILSHSRLIRRIHNIPEIAWVFLFHALQVLLKNTETEHFIVDSFPVKAYENHKSFRARIFRTKEYHGYNASRKQFFFGIKVHMVVDTEGIPIEFSFSPGSTSDIKSLEGMSLQRLTGSFLLADKAYTSYKVEELLLELDNIKLLARRRENLHRQHALEDEFRIRSYRNRIETVFSCIVRKMPRFIRAKTERGFCLKVMLFILAYMTNRYYPVSRSPHQHF